MRDAGEVRSKGSSLETEEAATIARQSPKARYGSLSSAAAAVLLTFGLLGQALPAKRARFSGPTTSQPLALSADGDLLAVANPDNNSVTFFDTSRPTPRLIDEVAVGREPSGVALSPDGREAYVANTLDGTVSVLKLNGAGRKVKLHKVLEVGAEPYGVVVTPNGEKVYVTNARSNTVTVINARNNHVLDTIEGVGIEPRGLAITNDGDDDSDNETVFVTQFLSLPSPGQLIGQLRKVGTFDPTAFNEVRANAAPPLGADGFVPPSLLSVFAFPQTFFHNGAANSLSAVLTNVTHRSAGTGGVDTLTNPADRQQLVEFLSSIDASTVPLP